MTDLRAAAERAAKRIFLQPLEMSPANIERIIMAEFEPTKPVIVEMRQFQGEQFRHAVQDAQRAGRRFEGLNRTSFSSEWCLLPESFSFSNAHAYRLRPLDAPTPAEPKADVRQEIVQLVREGLQHLHGLLLGLNSDDAKQIDAATFPEVAQDTPCTEINGWIPSNVLRKFAAPEKPLVPWTFQTKPQNCWVRMTDKIKNPNATEAFVTYWSIEGAKNVGSTYQELFDHYEYLSGNNVWSPCGKETV